MANMVIPNEGKILWDQWATGADVSGLEDYVFDLYQNSYTPVDGSSAANFLVASFPGYAQVPVARSTYGTPTIVSNVAYALSSVSPLWSCTSGGPQTVYGWYMRSASTGKVLAAAVFDVPWVMAAGATLTLSPNQLALKTFA